MKRDEVREFLRPKAHVSEALLSWLRKAGIHDKDIEHLGDWINFRVSVSQGEEMLNTRFYYFHNDDNTKMVRTLQYSVPEELASYIHMIQPTTRFGQLRRHGSMVFRTGHLATISTENDDCVNVVTPSCIRELYRIDQLGNGDSRNKLGVSGYLEHEASLDIDYAISLSNASAVFYTTGGRGSLVPDLDQPDPNHVSNEPYLDQLFGLLSLDDDKLPTVLTTSYGENEQSVPRRYTDTTMQDSNDGKKRPSFNPSFPAACPFVTSVGATVLSDVEEAIWFSSGGFSDRHPRPEYQDKAVRQYLKQLGDRWKGLYNSRVRGFPDVAALGRNFSAYDHGEVVLLSERGMDFVPASAPLFAAINSNLNSACLESGKGPLGFLNPWIYSLHQGFNDIVEGGSTGCTRTSRTSGLPSTYIPYASWNATRGWDPVTGLGTPLFDELLDAALRLR
ncbi:hypothetical protein VTO42DRAFT_3495 [Malbranchea cinnamomea]